MNLNEVTLCGRMGQDPEVSFTANGDAVCNISIAVSEYYKKDGDTEFTQDTTWVRVTAWRRLAERIAAVAKKGTEVMVQGKLREKQWEDKEGNKRSQTFVLANRLDFGDGRIIQDKDESLPKTQAPKKEAPAKDGEEESDLPF